MRAHALRFLALGSGLFLLVVDVGPLGWGVVGLFAVSFVADHVLLRPKRYVVDAQGFGGSGCLTRRGLRWDAVTCVHWRRYPGKERPPFPGGERIVIEVNEGADIEFVFARKYGGSAGRDVIAALLPVAGEKIRVLQPRSQSRDGGSSLQLSPSPELRRYAEGGDDSELEEGPTEGGMASPEPPREESEE
jgi:hypothetical protein